MARLLLLRHGQSTWNAEKRWQGWADPPLSGKGEDQSRRAAAWLAGHGFTGVVTSDLRRARQTAAILARELGLPEPVLDPRWRERDVGEWSGCTVDEIERRWPGQLAAWRAGRLDRTPGGETEEALTARVMDAVRHWVAAEGTLLVVTHGGVIHTVGAALGSPWAGNPNLGGAWVEAGPVAGLQVRMPEGDEQAAATTVL